MPSPLTVYGASGVYTANGSATSSSTTQAGHYYKSGNSPPDTTWISWWSWDLSTLPSDAVISAASASLAENSSDHTNPMTWTYSDTSASQGAAAGTLYSGGYTTTPSLSTSRVSVYRASTMWFRMENANTSSQNDWATHTVASCSITVTYNRPPGAPGAFTNPTGGTVSGTITVSWGAATDPEGNTITYYLERWNGSSWVALTNTTSTSYSWNTTSISAQTGAQLRVRAIDAAGSNTYSSYTTSSTFNISNVIARTGSDTAAATDAATRVATLPRTTSDTAPITSDSPVRGLTAGRSSSDTAAGTDSLGTVRKVVRTASDTP